MTKFQREPMPYYYKLDGQGMTIWTEHPEEALRFEGLGAARQFIRENRIRDRHPDAIPVDAPKRQRTESKK